MAQFCSKRTVRLLGRIRYFFLFQVASVPYSEPRSKISPWFKSCKKVCSFRILHGSKFIALTFSLASEQDTHHNLSIYSLLKINLNRQLKAHLATSLYIDSDPAAFITLYRT